MKRYLLNFFNPLKWLEAYRYNKKTATYDKSNFDLELAFYSKILKNDMLHWGYFDNVGLAPDSISIKQMEDAQLKYAENILNQINDKSSMVLDVGCGMGGLSILIQQNGIAVNALTPNDNQVAYINGKHPQIPCFHCKFEDFKSDQKYGTIIHSESLQYIHLEKAFTKVEGLLLPNGRWIITDYFRLHPHGTNKSSHLYADFLSKVEKKGWKISHEQDITLHVLPTIKLVNLYVERFLLPIKDLGFEKLRYKKAWLYFLTKELRTSVQQKIDKELTAIDPKLFVEEKKYMFLVLEKIHI